MKIPYLFIGFLLDATEPLTSSGNPWTAWPQLANATASNATYVIYANATALAEGQATGAVYIENWLEEEFVETTIPTPITSTTAQPVNLTTSTTATPPSKNATNVTTTTTTTERPVGEQQQNATLTILPIPVTTQHRDGNTESGKRYLKIGFFKI